MVTRLRIPLPGTGFTAVTPGVNFGSGTTHGCNNRDPNYDLGRIQAIGEFAPPVHAARVRRPERLLREC